MYVDDKKLNDAATQHLSSATVLPYNISTFISGIMAEGNAKSDALLWVNVAFLLNPQIAYILLTNRVRGPYFQLRTELPAWDINQREKTRIRNLQYGPRKRG